MKLKQYLNESANILYHGTTEEYAENIMSKGFKTGVKKDALGVNSISFTVDKRDAERFGDVVIKWNFKNLEKRFLNYDDEQIRNDYFDFMEAKNRLSSRYEKQNLKEYGNYVGIKQMEKRAIEYRVYDISVINKKDLYI